MYLVYLHRLLWSDVLRLHEAPRLIRAHRDGAAVEGPQLPADLLKRGAVAGVARKPEARVRADDGVASPQGPPPVPDFPRAPVLQQRWLRGGSQACQLC